MSISRSASVRGSCFAAAEHRECRISLPACFQQQSPRGGCRLEERYSGIVEETGQTGSIDCDVAVDQLNATADDQWQEDLESGDVKGERRDRQESVLCAHRQEFPHRLQ